MLRQMEKLCYSKSVRTKDIQFIIICSDIGALRLSLIMANLASKLGAGLFRNNVKLMVHCAAADECFSCPSVFLHRIKRTAFGTVVPFVSDFSAASAPLGNCVIARFMRLPAMLGVSDASAFFAEAAIPRVFGVSFFAAFFADAAVPSVLLVTLFAAFGADASIPSVLLVTLFAASFADAAIPSMPK